MLAAALDYQEYRGVGAAHEQALEALNKQASRYEKGVLDASGSIRLPRQGEAKNRSPCGA